MASAFVGAWRRELQALVPEKLDLIRQAWISSASNVLERKPARDIEATCGDIHLLGLDSHPTGATLRRPFFRTIQQGAAAYLAKPWDDERLIALVQGLLAVER